MVSITQQRLSAATQETPEGRAYYPGGRTGYLVDAATEARVARFLTSFSYAQIALAMVFIPLGSETNNRTLALVAYVATLMAIRYIGLRFVLRGAPRARTPMRHEDAVLRAAATYSAERIYLMAAAFIVVVPMPLFVFRHDPPWERATMVAIFFVIAAYACVFAARVLRAKAAMPRAQAEGDLA